MSDKMIKIAQKYIFFLPFTKSTKLNQYNEYRTFLLYSFVQSFA